MIELANHKLEYIDSHHLYLVDGVIAPSITQIMKVRYGGEYSAVSPEVLNNAAQLGTQMHKDIQNWEEMHLDNGNPELRNYKFLMKHKELKAVHCEVPVMLEHDGKFYCGRLDMIASHLHDLGIIDFKRRSAINKEELSVQLNLYKLAYEQTYKEEITFLAGMQLRENTRKYIEIPINDAIATGMIEEYERAQKEEETLPF